MACDVPFVHISHTTLTVVDLWRQGDWNFDGLYTQFPQKVKGDILGVPIHSMETGEDKIMWKAVSDGCYTIVTTYNLLNDDGGHESRFQKLVLKANALEKCSLLPLASEQRHSFDEQQAISKPPHGFTGLY